MSAAAGPPAFDEPRRGGQPAVAAGNESSEPETEGYGPQDEIAMVRRATEVLGIDHVARWMRSEIPSLGDRTPYALIKTVDGRSQVERVLLKIEHGVY
jgi:hypothetical protein